MVPSVLTNLFSVGLALANEIITLAFGMLLGAIAIEVAIVFGIGGRDIAAGELEPWVRSVKSKRE